MVALKHLLVMLAGAISVQATPAPTSKCCAADRCFAAASLPSSYKPTASSFCKSYIGKTPGTVTRTTTKTTTVTSTPTAAPTAPPRVTVTRTTTVTGPAGPSTTSVETQTTLLDAVISTETDSTTTTTVAGTVCTVTSTTSLGTQVNYATRGTENIDRRAYPTGKPAIPSRLRANCPSQGLERKVSSACSCFLTSATVTRTSTKTVTTVRSAGPAQTTTVTITTTATQSGAPGTTVLSTTVSTIIPAPLTTTTTLVFTSTEEPCTSTSTAYIYTGALSCGIPSPTAGTSGTVTCPNVAPPGETNARFRIEGGGQGTIFEDCIVTGPRNITTPSGGTHLCDGTNNNANPSPGGTLTTQIDSAGRQEGFGFDGSYDNRFQDFFITTIDQTRQTGNQFWGVLRNRRYTSRGGCQEPSVNGAESLWAFDAFQPNIAFLGIEPGYQVVTAGSVSSVTLTVSATNPNNGASGPAAGAVVDGVTADANGNLQLAVPETPGCYQYKAVRSGSIRSNAFYLTVLPQE